MPFKYETLTLPIPLGGLNTRDEPTLMNRLQTPSMQNMEIDRSSINKRLGYSLFGTWLPLRGIGMELIQYTDGPGDNHHIALTTTHAYEYNSSTDIWDIITPGEVLEDCEDVWVAGSGDTIATDSTIKVKGSKSVKITLASAAADGDKLAFEDFSAIDLTNALARTQIGFWLRSDTALAAGALEMVVSESANGAKAGTHSVSATSEALLANTWQFFSVDETLTDFNAVISVALYANTTIPDETVLYIDDVRAYTEFTGTSTDRWSHTIASNTAQFTANGGSALVISNGVDSLFSFEGITGEFFDTLLVSSDFTSFNFTTAVADFWNNLWLLNYYDNGVNFARNTS